MYILLYNSNNNMAKKWPGEWPKPYEFSPLYREKKARIQEMWYSDFIEFLNWVENINKWKKKEEWKRIVDLLFNKYSDGVIISLFERFRSFKRNKPEWYDYRKILNEIKEPLRTEIYGDNVVKNFFGWYGNYLKFVKNNRVRAEAKEMEKETKEKVAEVLSDEWAENHYAWKDRDIVDDNGDVIPNPQNEHIPVENEYVPDETLEIQMEEKKPESEEDGQLKIPFNFED